MKEPVTPGQAGKESTPRGKRSAYWARNIRYLLVLLGIWLVVSYGCGIIFAEQLNEYRLAGFKLGFWFAQQGSIYVFVVLIFVYVRLMNRLDDEFTVPGGGRGRR